MIPIKGGSWWLDHAAQITARYPLAATDWDQHSDAVEAGLYSLQKSTEIPAPAAPRNCDFADTVPPMSPEEEEAAYVLASAPAQMELF